MNNSVTISLTDTDSIQHTYTDILSLTIKKERFTPYSYAAAFFISSDEHIQYKDISISVNGFTAHYGLIDSVHCRKNSHNTITSVISKSFTSLLLQNQLVPGMMYDISLNSLMDSFITIPHISHEDNSDIQNYIFIKENSSLWEAVANISYKISGIYPYIRQNNMVCISDNPSSVQFPINSDKILESGFKLDYSKIVSDYHMQDIEGNYDVYQLNIQQAYDLDIIRHRQIPLDRQYLNNPSQSMQNKLEFSMRGYSSHYYEYIGYSGEDIYDLSAYGEKIDAVTIKGGSDGIRTTITTYH
ncbi:MAG: hypothetical protein ACI4JM_04020 [Oscillospiraceae bacterium]